jgi:hypothetical protein
VTTWSSTSSRSPVDSFSTSKLAVFDHRLLLDHSVTGSDLQFAGGHGVENPALRAKKSRIELVEAVVRNVAASLIRTPRYSYGPVCSPQITTSVPVVRPIANAGCAPPQRADESMKPLPSEGNGVAGALSGDTTSLVRRLRNWRAVHRRRRPPSTHNGYRIVCRPFHYQPGESENGDQTYREHAHENRPRC